MNTKISMGTHKLNDYHTKYKCNVKAFLFLNSVKCFNLKVKALTNGRLSSFKAFKLKARENQVSFLLDP